MTDRYAPHHSDFDQISPKRKFSDLCENPSLYVDEYPLPLPISHIRRVKRKADGKEFFLAYYSPTLIEPKDLIYLGPVVMSSDRRIVALDSAEDEYHLSGELVCIQ